MALTGIDASRHQGVIDWAMVRNAGHAFAFIKATDGIAYRYVNWYHQNAPQVQASGLVLGAYHFLVDHYPGDLQARYYVDEVNRTTGFAGTVPIVDIEREQDGTTPGPIVLREFVAEFRRLVPNRPILIYTGRWYWVGVLKDPHGADLGPLWHSEYDGISPIDEDVANGPELDNYGGWTHATVWQHTSSGTCPGVAGLCDLNLFYGTAADLAALAGGPLQPEDDMTPEEHGTLIDIANIVHSMHGGNYLTANGGDLSWLDQKLAPLEARLTAIEAGVASGVPVDVDAIAAAVVAAMPGQDPAAVAAAVEAIVRRVFADAGTA